MHVKTVTYNSQNYGTLGLGLIVSYLATWLHYDLISRTSTHNNNSWLATEKIYVTRHEKIGLMYTKYTPSHYSTYLNFYVSYMSYVNCIKFPLFAMYIEKFH